LEAFGPLSVSAPPATMYVRGAKDGRDFDAATDHAG